MYLCCCVVVVPSPAKSADRGGLHVHCKVLVLLAGKFKQPIIFLILSLRLSKASCHLCCQKASTLKCFPLFSFPSLVFSYTCSKIRHHKPPQKNSHLKQQISQWVYSASWVPLQAEPLLRAAPGPPTGSLKHIRQDVCLAHRSLAFSSYFPPCPRQEGLMELRDVRVASKLSHHGVGRPARVRDMSPAHWRDWWPQGLGNRKGSWTSGSSPPEFWSATSTSTGIPWTAHT